MLIYDFNCAVFSQSANLIKCGLLNFCEFSILPPKLQLVKLVTNQQQYSSNKKLALYHIITRIWLYFSCCIISNHGCFIRNF